MELQIAKQNLKCVKPLKVYNYTEMFYKQNLAPGLQKKNLAGKGTPTIKWLHPNKCSSKK